MISTRTNASFMEGEGKPVKLDMRHVFEAGRVQQILPWVLLAVTLCLAITRQSLWIDEGFTAWLVSHKSIASFFSRLIGSPGAPGDAHMLLYLLYMWAWVKLVGISELSLRAANVPFAILLVGTMSWASRRLFRQPNLWVFFCLSPFVWFYLNEARPYVALVTFSAIAIVSLLAYVMCPADYKLFAPWCCLGALLLAWGTHVLGAFLFPSIFVLMAATAKDDPIVRRSFVRDWFRPFLFFLPAFILLGAFYVWVSRYGVRKEHRDAGLSNIAFILYEFMGFGGLGPPRNEIRENPSIYVFLHYWPWLLLGLATTLAAGYFLFERPTTRIVRNLTGSVLVGFVIAFAVSKLEHFRVLGRHMAVFFPILLIIVALWLKRPPSPRHARYATTAALCALGIAWAISDARLVFLRKYEKDSYRSASTIAVSSAYLSGGKILWAADPHTARYYGIQVIGKNHMVDTVKDDGVDWPVTTEALDAQNWSWHEALEYLETSSTPTILVLSKADLFDTKGAWRILIRQEKPMELARLTGFTIYGWRPHAVVGMADLEPTHSVSE